MPTCSSQLQAHWFLSQEIILIYNMQNKCYMFTTDGHNFTQFLSVLVTMTPPLAEEILCSSVGAALKPVFQQELVPECVLAFLQHYKHNFIQC